MSAVRQRSLMTGSNEDGPVFNYARSLDRVCINLPRLLWREVTCIDNVSVSNNAEAAMSPGE
jgi:hypothetical protein